MSISTFLIATIFFPSHWIYVPLDHWDANSRKIGIEYILTEPFDPSKQTILTHEDPFDDFLGLGEVLNSELADFNIIRIKGRYFSSEFDRFLGENLQAPWVDKYRWLNRYQIIKDMEWIRKDVLGDNPVILLGFGSSAGLAHYYLHEYPNQVEKVVSLNPLLLDMPKNLSFWDLLEGFDYLTETYSSDQIVRFSTQSFAPYFFMDKPIRDSLIETNIKEFVKSFGENSFYELSPSLVVRSFEHLMDTGPYDLGPFGHLLELISIEIRDETFGQIFENYRGTNYDRGKDYSSKMILIGGAYNLLLDPKSFDVIGEFYPNSNVFLLKDGYDFSVIRKMGLLNELLFGFCSNEISDQIKIYEKLQRVGLLFQNKDYNSIRIGKK